MLPARTHACHMAPGAAVQDKGPDGERYRADTTAGVVIHVRDLNPTLSTLDAPSTDRCGDSTAAVFTSVATSATTSRSFSSWLHMSEPTDNSDQTALETVTDQTALETATDQTALETATYKTALETATDQTALETATSQTALETATDKTALETATDQTALETAPSQTALETATDKTALETAPSQTGDGDLPRNSDSDGELENRETAGQADGELSLMESRQHKRKLRQSAMFPVDVITFDIFKQAKVEEDSNFNNYYLDIDIFRNQGEVQHQLAEDRLMQTQGRHRLKDGTVNRNVLTRETGTCHLHIDRYRLGDEGGAECLVTSADTSPVCEGEHRAVGMAGGDSRQLETQPHLWARMEDLCKTTPAKRFTGAAIKRSLAEKFKPRYKPNHLVDSHAAKQLVAGNSCHHGNIRTRSQITRRASSKPWAISIRTRSSRSLQTVDRCPARHRYRLRSNSSSDESSRSRSRSHSPVDSNRGQSCDCDSSADYTDGVWSSQEPCRCQQEARSWWRCCSRASLTSHRPLSPSPCKQAKTHLTDRLDIIKQLFAPLVLPPSMTTVIAAPVTGTTGTGKGNGGAASNPSAGNSVDNKHPSTAALSSPEKAKKINGGHNSFPPNMGDKNKFESRGNNEASFEANSMSLPPRPQNMSHSRGGGARMDAGNPEHYMGPPARSGNHFGEHSDHNMQREEQRYEPHFNNMGYHPGMDHSFHEDAGYEFYGADYDYLYDERNDEYGYGNEPYPPHPHQRHPGPNTYYPRRPPPQGPRGPPQMFAPNDRSYGPPRPNMGGPSSRMGPNGPVGSRGPRSPMGPRGHRPQGGPGGPLGPPVMRGPPRGSPYGPPRGSPYGPPGPMRPQGMRGPPGPGMMGQAGHGGPAGPRPRLGPPARMQSPMPRQGSQPPSGPRPRMGPPPSGPPPRDDQYLPQRPAVLPPNPGDPSYCNPLPNFSQPPPNFVPSTSSQPPPIATTAAASAAQIADVVVPPPPLPPPKPPTPKPPPPPKKEEEKKEEIKPMTPLIPPEQAEQYRKLREQARKHARKQQRKQEHQAKGEPESSDDDEEEAAAKKKEYEAKLSAEREEMEKAALLAVEDNGALHFEEGATILMPATQQTLMQQPTVMVQHHPLASQPSSYGLVPASHFMHATHPGLHPSQLQNLQFMTSGGQPQLVQLPNGQMAYAMAAPMSYQPGAQIVAMPQQSAMSAGAMPHHMLFSPGAMHQVPVTAHSGLTVSGSQYMAHVMASHQAAQIQAAQAAQIQAAQAAQVQAAQAAQVQAVQAAQIQAAQVAQVQAVQAAQAQAVQAAQVQAAQVQSGMVPGMHMAQHVLPGMHPQGQYILVPRVARPQM